MTYNVYLMHKKLKTTIYTSPSKKGFDRIMILPRSTASWNLTGTLVAWSLSYANLANLKAPRFLLCFAKAYRVPLQKSEGNLWLTISASSDVFNHVSKRENIKLIIKELCLNWVAVCKLDIISSHYITVR